MNKKRRNIILSNNVSRLETYSLGGHNQNVLLEGKNANNPIMLSLHGGPGFPIPFSVGCRGMFPEFTDNFIMVYWDQLGCGINNYVIDNNFTINDFTEMAVDLVKTLKKEFPNNKLILLGTSWGSILAAQTAAKVPKLIDNVLIYGQILKDLFFNTEVYETLNNAHLPKKTKDNLSMLKETKQHSINDIKAISSLIGKYTEGYQMKTVKKMPIGDIVLGLLQSPDYSLKDFISVIHNGFRKNESILKEVIEINLSNTINNIQVPYRILQGRYDIVTSTKDISSFVEECSNKYVSLRVIENSTHIPSAYGMDEILKESLSLR